MAAILPRIDEGDEYHQEESLPSQNTPNSNY
jgi:hypothetical protein